MTTITVQPTLTPKQANELVGTYPDDLEPNITTETVAVTPDGTPVFAYLPLGDVADLRRVCLDMHYGATVRTHTGYKNKSRTFGYAPRRPVQRREGCGITALARDNGDQEAVLDRWAGKLADMLHTAVPTVAEADTAAMRDNVLPEWRINDLWTSGVVNNTSQLPYHRDAFNFPTWSAMPVLRRHTTGGYLHLPEYDATFGCRDGWGVFFAGYNLVHGVTPMHRTKPDGYRYSIVYYALRGMKDCHTAAEETAYARRRRTEREQDIARRARTGEAMPSALNPNSDLHRG